MSGISYDQPFVLAQMGLFHDIGKTMLNQDVLNKPTILTNAEQTYIQHHTTIGLDALKKVGIYSEKIKESVLLHHENRTGNGYPFGYSKESIPFSVQVISVADTFDSIASDRVYKKHKPLLETFNELYFEATKGKLHPLIVLSFIEETMNYFLNHKIILSNGEIGIIYYNNPLETIRPIILLEDKSFIDLSQNRGIFMVDFI
jgi:HD-GYP domain-containing protein (c-di-GMP phosphodiesterase class II)